MISEAPYFENAPRPLPLQSRAHAPSGQLSGGRKIFTQFFKLNTASVRLSSQHREELGKGLLRCFPNKGRGAAWARVRHPFYLARSVKRRQLVSAGRTPETYARAGLFDQLSLIFGLSISSACSNLGPFHVLAF